MPKTKRKPIVLNKETKSDQEIVEVIDDDTESIEPVKHKKTAEKDEVNVRTHNTGKKVSTTEYGIGLDVGTGFLVGASFAEDGTVITESIRDAFLAISAEKFNPRLLDKQRVKYIQIGDNAFIVGEEAVDFAAMTNAEASRPLAGGVINPQERQSATILTQLFGHTVKPFIKREGEKCVFSVPGKQIGNPEFDVDFHSMSIQQLLMSFGLEAEPINEAYAVALSELGTDIDSALSFSFGAGLVNACFTFKGLNLFEFSTPQSGDYVDQMAAKNTGESISSVCKLKEDKLDLSLNYTSNVELQALKLAYTAMIRSTVKHVKNAFSRDQNIRVREDIPVVISGGTSKVPGFVDLFISNLEKVGLDFGISEVIVAEDQLTAVAKGCLIWANHLEDE